MILTDAIRQNASDVHVEVQRDKVRIRFRVDGLLRDVMTAPRSAAGTLISRLKILGGLDIAERRRPQDGRARFAAEGRQVDCRMSTLPSLHGEKVVLRLLMRSVDLPPLEAIGLERAQLDLLLSAVSEPQGLVLITGPTGSGKTSTLYAVINKIIAPEKNIVTLEDPVEIAFPGITQVPIFERTGLTFAAGLRSILRQDPDVILVGEVRDLETAELALQASLTGHLVLSTLHTNDAVGAVARLVDMGAQIFLIAGSLSLVIAQRLVRRPCTECMAPYRPDARLLELLGLREQDLTDATPMRGRGCHLCAGSGYRGRLGVFEVLPITNTIRQAVLDRRGRARRWLPPRAAPACARCARTPWPRRCAGRRRSRRSCASPRSRPTSTQPFCARRAAAGWPTTWSPARGAAPRRTAPTAVSAPSRSNRAGGPAPTAATRSPPRSLTRVSRELRRRSPTPGERRLAGMSAGVSAGGPAGDGDPAAATPTPGAAQGGSPSADAIRSALATVRDPEIGRPITDLGMVRRSRSAPTARSVSGSCSPWPAARCARRSPLGCAMRCFPCRACATWRWSSGSCPTSSGRRCVPACAGTPRPGKSRSPGRVR